MTIKRPFFKTDAQKKFFILTYIFIFIYSTYFTKLQPQMTQYFQGYTPGVLVSLSWGAAKFYSYILAQRKLLNLVLETGNFIF